MGASVVIGVGLIGGALIASQGAKSAAKKQANAQEEAIKAQERTAEEERIAQQQATAKEEQTRQAAIARKEEAAKNINYPTYLETATAPLLRKTLEEKLAGKGLVAPVTPLDIDKQASPFAAQRRAGLEKESAIISATASSRGLGRSTLPVKQIGASSQAAERDIEQRVAELQIENKKIEESNIERERQQKESALSSYQQLTGAEAETQANKALFQRGGEFDIADTMTGKAGAIGQAERGIAQEYASDQTSIANAIAQKGATEAAYELQQAQIWAGAIQGVGGSAAQTTEELLQAVKNQKASQSAMVNISGRTQKVPVAPAGYAGYV